MKTEKEVRMEEMVNLKVSDDDDDVDHSEDSVKDDEVAERVTWGGNFEFLLSVIGYTVGLSNIWRFPYFVYRNGGGVALIPFLLFLIFCGGPTYYIEVCLGQFSGRSAIGVWDICPLFKGIGCVMACLSLVYIWYFGMCFGWVFYYLIQSFYPTLAWSTCNNTWNTPMCIDATTNLSEKALSLNISVQNATFNLSGAEFWEYNVLAKSSGIDDMGSVQLHLVGCLALGWLLVFLCLIKGVQSLGKVVYVTATLPYVLLTVLLIRGLTLDGAMDGLEKYLKPDFSKLLTSQVWIEAAVQCFFSLGPAFGGIITMASFNKFRHNILRDTVIVCFADGFTGFYSGLVVFSVLGFLAKETGTPFDELPFSGPSLAFITYPEAISRLPLPHVWAVLFFFTLVLVGIDSVFGTFETISNAIIDTNYQRLHRYRTLITAGLIIFLIVASIPLAMSGGVYLFLLTDWYCATFNTVGTALVELIVVGWLYGASRFSSDIELMTGSRPPLVIRVLWCFVIPVFITAILVTSAITFGPPNYGDGYSYPSYAIAAGTVLAFAPLVSLFGISFGMIGLQKTGSFPQRVKTVLRPSNMWLPNDPKQRQIYKCRPIKRRTGFRDRFLIDILGVKEE